MSVALDLAHGSVYTGHDPHFFFNKFDWSHFCKYEQGIFRHGKIQLPRHQLSHYITLTDADRQTLAKLEDSERKFDAGQEVYQGGDKNKDLYVVKNGWAFSYTDLPDGRRQIVKIHHPGDIIGFPDVALKHSTTTLRTVEAVCLCPFPKSSLDEILRKSPRLSALLLSIALRDHVVLIDVLRAMGRHERT